MPYEAPEAAAPAWREALERLRGAFAESTLGQYRSAFGKFESWSRAEGLGAAPAEPAQVARYLESLFARGFTHLSVVTYMHAIRRVHHALQLPDPTLDQEVWLALRRGRRASPPPQQAFPINAGLRDRLAAACRDDLEGLRDRVILFVGYDGLCRRHELVRLRFEDIQPLADGGARIVVREGKTDVARLGDHAFLSVRSVEALEAWKACAALETGPILRILMKGMVGGGVTQPGLVQRRLRALAASAGIEPAIVSRITGHSLRVGAAQDLAASGYSLLQIMLAGRWRTPDQVLHYVRRGAVNVWSGRDGDAYALARHSGAWRRRSQRHRAVDPARLDAHPKTRAPR